MLIVNCSNYVIQFMIQLDGTNIGRRIIKELTHKFVELSMDKYGSNVVEKCLSCCEGVSNDIIFEILEGNGRDRLIQICTNQYGNFVVQTVMSIAKVCVYFFPQLTYLFILYIEKCQHKMYTLLLYKWKDQYYVVTFIIKMLMKNR